MTSPFVSAKKRWACTLARVAGAWEAFEGPGLEHAGVRGPGCPEPITLMGAHGSWSRSFCVTRGARLGCLVGGQRQTGGSIATTVFAPAPALGGLTMV